MLQLVAGRQPSICELRPLCVAGNLAWRPFRPPPDHSRSRRYFSGFVLAGIPQRSLRNSSRIGNGGRRLLAGFVEILRNFSGFAAQHLRDTKPQKFVAYQEGGLKPAAG
jgi:hypothetical protein